MSRTTFRFLDLHPELRNEIYTHALQQPTPIRLEYIRGIRTSENDNIPPRQSPPPKLAINLLRTCRQIHQEANPILYSSNTFAPALGDCSYLRLFLKQLGSRVEYIRHIELPRAAIADVRKVCHLLKQATFLESVTFVVPEWAIREDYREVEAVRPLMRELRKKRRAMEERRTGAVGGILRIRERGGAESESTKKWEKEVREELGRQVGD